MGINFGNLGSTNTTATPASTGAVNILDLNKGDLLDLTKTEPGLKNVLIGAGWDANNSVPAFDLDISTFLLNSQGKFVSTDRIIYFKNKSNHGVTLSGDNTTGSGEGDDEQIVVNLDQVPADVVRIDFVINIYEAQQRRQTFGMVNNSYIRVMNHDNGDAELCRFRLKEEYASSTAVIIASLKRGGDGWQFEAVGDGKVVRDLNDIAALYM